MIVVITATAAADLERIGDSIAADNPRRATAFIAELRESCGGLTHMPERFALVPRYAHLGIRRRVHGNYLIFYSVSTSAVEILHVLHGAMDIDSILSTSLPTR